MTRPDPYGLESKKQHPQSPGLIGDREIICRGGFNPMHYSNGKPKNSIIRAGELLTGSLSVWRGGTGEYRDFQSAVAEIGKAKPQGQTLRSVFAPQAGEIRDIQIDEAIRVFYVVDDCVIDQDGNSHELHAGIKLCPSLNIGDKEDDIFIQAKNHLLRVLKNSEIEIEA